MITLLDRPPAPSRPPTLVRSPDQRRLLIVEAIHDYQRAGTVSFSTPGQKHGAGLDPALRTLLGPALGAADCWLNTAQHCSTSTEHWGPHFGFHPALPSAALPSGADGSVMSPHKLLNGLSQAAVLHVQGSRIDAARVATAVAMTRTTSPLLPILASLDVCRRQMALAGESLLDHALARAEDARDRLRGLPGVDLLDATRLGLPQRYVDPTRLVIDVAGLGLTGFAAEQALRQRHAIAPEMSNLLSVICLITPGDSSAGVDRLVAAVSARAAQRCPTRSAAPASLRSIAGAVAPGTQVLTPREAFFAPTRAVPLAKTVGAIVAEPVVPYPPGIPVLTPGEIVSHDKVAYLCAVVMEGLHIRGPADPALRTLRVVDA